MLNDVADVAQSVSVILACMFTIYGIDSWRREFVGKPEWNSRTNPSVFYQARDAIEDMRSPFGYAGEGATWKASQGESPEHKDALDQAFSLVERYKRHAEMFAPEAEPTRRISRGEIELRTVQRCRSRAGPVRSARVLAMASNRPVRNQTRI